MHDTVRIPALKIRAHDSVLLIEDDELVARMLVRQIADAGYEVKHVTRAAEAVERVMNGSFDIVVSDLNLPGASGVDVLEVVRAYDKDVALVLMTGAPTLESAIEAVSLGVVEYILKPTTHDDLVRALRRASDKRQSVVIRREIRASQAPETTSGVCASIRTTFDRAMASLTVELEPVVETRSRNVIGFAARMASEEETLSSQAALVLAADRLGRLQDLRRRARDLAVREFADAPPGSLLFVDVHESDLLDGDLYSTDPPLARIADRVVLQVRGCGGLGLRDIAARASVLRFVGFRIAITDLDDGEGCLSQVADLSPEFVKIEPQLVRCIDRMPARQRMVAGIVSMCRKLEAVVIAEGVSTAEERAALETAGCELVQGSLVARHSPKSQRRPQLELIR